MGAEQPSLEDCNRISQFWPAGNFVGGVLDASVLVLPE